MTLPGPAPTLPACGLDATPAGKRGVSSPVYPQIHALAVLTPAAANAYIRRSALKDSSHALA